MSKWTVPLKPSNNFVYLNPALSYNWLQAHIHICPHPINNLWTGSSPNPTFFIFVNTFYSDECHNMVEKIYHYFSCIATLRYSGELILSQ